MTADAPIVTFDLDGVLCRPPFGLNPGSLKADRREGAGRWNPAWLVERWRFYGRRPMPGAREGFTAIAEFARCAVVTGRSEHARAHTEAWLQRNLGTVPPLYMRATWRERPPEFKARVLAELGAVAHFEDDPNTARLLAPDRAVFLVAWPRNEGFSAANVVRVGSVAGAVDEARRVALEALR